MSQNVMIEPVNNGWIVKVYDPEYDEGDTSEAAHAFTEKQELLDFISDTLEEE